MCAIRLVDIKGAPAHVMMCSCSSLEEMAVDVEDIAKVCLATWTLGEEAGTTSKEEGHMTVGHCLSREDGL